MKNFLLVFKNVGCDPCGRPNKRKQHDKSTQNKVQNQILNLFKQGDHKGRTLQNTN